MKSDKYILAGQRAREEGMIFKGTTLGWKFVTRSSRDDCVFSHRWLVGALYVLQLIMSAGLLILNISLLIYA
jgi:hypothetical protein